VLTQYLKEHLLKGKQKISRVNDLPNKLATRDKTEPIGSQKVGHENGHLRVTWLGHLVMSSGMGKC